MKHTTAWIAFGLLLAPSGCTESNAPATSPGGPPPASETAQGGSVEELQQILDDPDPYSRARRLAELVPTLDDEALPRIRKILDRFRPQIGVVEFDLMLRHWANRRPEEAARWAVDDSPRLYRLNAIRTALEALARVDPEMAVPLILQAYAQDTEKGTIAQFAVVDGWFQKDPAETLEYIQQLGQGISRQRGLHAYATVLAAAEGTDATIRWAESFPEDDAQFKQEAFQQVLGALAWVDPDAAKRFCEAHCDGPYASGLRGVLVRSQLREGETGGDIIDWVVRTTKTETEDQRFNLEKTLNLAYVGWAAKDHEAAIAWMEQKLAQPEHEPWLKALYPEYARQIAKDDPARALEWAEKGEDTITMIRIARYWLALDEEAAEAWLDQSPLDEKQRERARNPSLPYFLPRITSAPVREVRNPGASGDSTSSPTP